MNEKPQFHIQNIVSFIKTATNASKSCCLLNKVIFLSISAFLLKNIEREKQLNMYKMQIKHNTSQNA